MRDLPVFCCLDDSIVPSSVSESISPTYVRSLCLCLDTKCFSRSLTRSRDSGFITFGELCRYLRKSCSRALLPKHTPADNDWSSLLQLSLDDCRKLSCRDFLSRLKLKFDLEAASRDKARKENSEKKNLSAIIDGLTETVKDTFATQARSYIVFVIDSLLKDIRLTAGIVRGLASLDLTVPQTQPMDQALFCFRALFHSFQLRGWVEENEESEYREDYVEFLDHLRHSCGPFKPPESVVDVVALLISMPALRSRPRLLHLFKLSCLCLTETSPDLPPIPFPGADSSDPDCRLSNILLPAQSYLATVPNSEISCVTEAALTKFLELESRFSSGNVPGDPWAHVDSFGQSNFYRALLTAFKSQGDVVSTSNVVRSRSSSIINEGSDSAFRSPGKTVKFAHEGVISVSEVAKTVKELQ